MNWLHHILRRPFLVTFWFGGGASVTVHCKSWSVSESKLNGRMTGYSLNGIAGEKPAFISIGDVVAVTTRRVWL